MNSALLTKSVDMKGDSMTALLDRSVPGGFFDLLPSTAKTLWKNLPFGGDDRGGIGTEGDIVYTTQDGVDINSLWEEAQAAVGVWNQGRNRLVDLLTFPVTNEIETVPQVGEAAFEVATEFEIGRAHV